MVSFLQLLHLVLPEIIVVATALLVLSADLLFLRASTARTRSVTTAILGSVGCLAAIVKLVLAHEQATFLNGVFLADPLTRIVQIAVLVLSIFTLLLFADSDFTEHVGEFVLLVLLATIGMMFLVATHDILVLFISLELLSLSLYVLAGFDKRSLRSSEAALKYFLFGGTSAAFLLFGFSLLYGLSNSTDLTQIATAMSGPSNPLFIIAMIMVVVGLGFKIAAAPFHFWAPDVYQAAPAPSAAFIASASKVASFFVFFQFVALTVPAALHTAAVPASWETLLTWTAAISMVLGSLVALRQTSLRRLLAYSTVAHAGYMLLALVAHTQQSLAALLYYVITYALATLGAFAVVQVIETATGSDEFTAALNGLSRRAPLVSVCLLVFLLSPAGIPPLAGFFGKFYLFAAALSTGTAGLRRLVVLALAMSAVSLYYYLQVLKRAYVVDSQPDAAAIQVPLITRAALVLLTASVVVLGCAPHLLLRWILAVSQALGR